MVVSNISLCSPGHPYLVKWSNWTNMSQIGWNHQLVLVSIFDFGGVFLGATGGGIWWELIWRIWLSPASPYATAVLLVASPTWRSWCCAMQCLWVSGWNMLVTTTMWNHAQKRNGLTFHWSIGCFGFVRILLYNGLWNNLLFSIIPYIP